MSGSGGLGEEGIVPAPAPEGKASPGEGRRGAISGESSWKGEMVGVDGKEEEREEREEREMKRMMMRSLLRKEEAIFFFIIFLFWFK